MRFYDIQKKEPKISIFGKEESFSNQLFIYINGSMYLGHYFSTGDKDSEKGLEIAVYESIDLYSAYQMSTMITKDHFNDYEIYWCEISMNEIINMINIDLDMEEEENVTT